DAVGELRRQLEAVLRHGKENARTEQMAGPGMIEQGVILVHQLHVDLIWEVLRRAAVFEIKCQFIAGRVDAERIVGKVEIVAKGNTGMSLAAKFLGARDRCLKSIDRMNRQARAAIIGVGLQSWSIEIAQEKLRLPGPQPFENGQA